MSLEHPRLSPNGSPLRLRTVVFAGALVLVFVLPWRALLTITDGVTAARALGALVGIAWLALVVKTGMRPLDRFHVVLFGLVVWSGLSVVWSVDTAATAFAFVTLLSGGLFSVVLWDLLRSEDRIVAAAFAYVAGCYVVLVIEGAEFLFLGGHRVGDVVSGPNYVAGRLVFGLPFAWYAAVRPPYGRSTIKYVAGAYLPIAAVAVLLTRSRQGFVALALAFGLIALAHAISRRQRPGIVAGALAGTALAVSLAAVALSERFQQALALDRLVETLDFLRGDVSATEAGLDGRLEIYAAGVEVFRSSALVGTGAGSFPSAVEPLLGGRATPHSTYLALAVETGVVGLGLFGLLLFCLLVGLRGLGSERALAGASLLALYLLVSLVNTWFADFTALFVLTMVLLGASPLGVTDCGTENNSGHNRA